MQRPGSACSAALAEFTTDVVMLVSRDALILWASPSTREVLGFVPEALVGTRPRDLCGATFSVHLLSARRVASPMPNHSSQQEA